MKRLLSILFSSTLLSCGTQQPSLTGSYCRCLHDGEYQEHSIGENRIMFFGSNFPDNINIMSNQILGNDMIVEGLNFDLMFGTDTLTVVALTDSSLTLNNQFGDFELERLNFEIPAIDSLNLEQSVSELLTGFRERSLTANCPDLRTEEEKNPKIPLGVIEDDFEDIIDINELPKWAATKYSKYKQNFERSFALVPSFLVEDFSGDGTDDIAIFVSNKSNERKGILFLLGDSDLMFIAGAGHSFGPSGDNFEWADYWELFTKSKTFETTFFDNGDIDGTREVRLDHPGISIKENEGSGGLIYYNSEKFVWIHQGD